MPSLRTYIWLSGLGLGAGCGPTTTSSQTQQVEAKISPPVAQVIPKTVNLGGKSVVDNYWWMREKSDPAVIAYLKAENAYADAVMKPTASLQEQLYKEMSDRLPDANESVPYRYGDWWYSTRHDQEYPVYLRRPGSPTAKPVVIADANELAKGHDFFDFVLGR